MVIIPIAAISDAAVALPHEARQAFLAIVGGVVIAVGRHAVEVHKDEAWIASGADADAAVA